jgi:outer membrane protein TolC
MKDRRLQINANAIWIWSVAMLVLSLGNFNAVFPITIDDAVQMALKSNQDYLVARSQLVKADAEIQKATAGALPKLDLNTNYTRNLKIPEVVFGGQSFKLGTDNQIDAGLSFSQPLWLGGKVFAALKIAKLYRKYTEQAVKNVEMEITFGVRRTFLGAILANDVVSVYQDALAAAELNLDMVTKMQSQGVVSEYELLRAEVEVANLKPQLTQSRNQAVTARDELKHLIGVPLSDSLSLEYIPTAVPPRENLRLEHINEIARGNRALLKQQDYKKEITRRAIGIAKSGRSFTLEFQSRYNWLYQSDDMSLDRSHWSPNWTAGVTFKLPIFDGFVTSAQVKQAVADNHEVELAYDQMKEQIELEVRQAYFDYLESGERLEASQKTIEQAEEGLKIARLRYGGGVGTQLEVLSAESALTQAKTNHVQATHDAAIAVFQLLRVSGSDNFDQLKER